MAAALVAVMAAGAAGYFMGARANEAKHTRALLKVAQALNDKEVERLALQGIIDAQAQALEDASYTADASDPVIALPLSRVRRLNER